jgi:hypothetical protein
VSAHGSAGLELALVLELSWLAFAPPCVVLASSPASPSEYFLKHQDGARVV